MEELSYCSIELGKEWFVCLIKRNWLEENYSKSPG